MKKIRSLIKATMTDNMNIFKIRTKTESKLSKKILPIILTIFLFGTFWSYANMIMEPLSPLHLEYIGLSIFVIFTSIMTIIEGIYKSGNLLFNCKDDNLLFSLPIKRRTILFVRIFKFYVFELIYNSIFLLPAMVTYIRYASVDLNFYISSICAIILLPIIPIIISCLIGTLITGASSKSKRKNFVQIILTTIFLLLVFYVSFNLQGLLSNIVENATSINDIITKLYYPAGVYIKLITDFNVIDLVTFVGIHILLSVITIFALSKVYFKINTNSKAIRGKSKNKVYKVKINKPIIALIKKEGLRFINSPVFVINAGFGLVLFIVGCVLVPIKLDSTLEMLANNGMQVAKDQVLTYIPLILFGFIVFSSLMSSITCSMISLEGKTFNILKSLPIKPFKILFAKVLTAVIIMIPFFVIGDIVVFTQFEFSLLEMVLILIASFVLPILSETFGIIVNLKYPKMDAENDTEVVKQSMSTMIATFGGFIFSGLTVFLLVKAVETNLSIDQILIIGTAICSTICLILLIYLSKKSVREFNKINV